MGTVLFIISAKTIIQIKCLIIVLQDLVLIGPVLSSSITVLCDFSTESQKSCRNNIVETNYSTFLVKLMIIILGN